MKKIPIRQCIACREHKPKNEMLRFVIKPEDAEIIYDEKGKASARGAYICPKNECLARAKKTRAFERVFSKKTEDSFFEEALRIIENKDE